MHNLKAIRDHMGLTQQALGDGIGCTQGNVGFYERGQELPPDRARTLIDFAARYGLVITFDHIYGDAALPELIGTEGAPAIPATAKAEA